MDSQSIHFRHFTKNDPVCGNLITGLLGPVAKAGFQYDIHIIENLDKIPDDYPIYVFLNSFHLSGIQRETIRRRFQKKGNLIVWTYGAGYFTGADDEAYDCRDNNITDATGITARSLISTHAAPRATSPEGLWETEGKETSPLSPLFYIDDADAVSLATFTDTGDDSLDGKCAAAVKSFRDHRSVYLGIPLWTPQILRMLARLGGVPLYNPNDSPEYVLRVGNGHLLLHTSRKCEANLVFPSTIRRVVDVTNGSVLGENVDTLTVPVQKRNSRYLRLEK